MEEEGFEQQKHELSKLGLTAHLNKSAPDTELVAQLIAALHAARADAAASQQRERDAAGIVDAASEAARTTHQHASTLAAENANLRAQSRRLAQRLDDSNAALVAAHAAASLHDDLQHDRADHAAALAQLAAELEHVPPLRTALARAEARARDAEHKRHELQLQLASLLDSASADAALRAELARVQRLLDETRGLHSVALAALDDQTRARAAADEDRAALVARLELLADADDERAGLLAELNDAYRHIDDVEADRARLLQLVHQCERSLAELQLAIELADQQRAPDAAPEALAQRRSTAPQATTTTTATTAAAAAAGEARAQSTSPPPPAPRAAAPAGAAAAAAALEAALAANGELRAHIDGLERSNAQLVMTLREVEAREREAEARARIAEQHQRDLTTWVDELRKYITDTAAHVRERDAEQQKKCALLEQQANKHGAQLAAVERERDALQHYISCYEAELIKTTVR